MKLSEWLQCESGKLKLGLSRRGTSGGGITSLSMTGLTSGEARPGGHASISVGFPSGVTSWTAQSWGVGAYGDSTYGTGASPTDYTASDTLSLLWEGQGDDGNTYRSSAPIRYALGTDPSIATQSWTVDDESGTIDGSASGTNLTFSNYQIVDVPSTVTINPSTGQITKSLPFATVGASGSDTGTVSCVDQYNRPYSGAFDWSYALRTQATAAGALADQSFTENTGDQTFATAGDITANGNTLTYPVNAVTGVTINPSTGVVTFDTNLMALQSSTAIVVTPTDEYLRTSPTGFGVSISAAPAFATLNDVTLTENGDGTLDADVDATNVETGVDTMFVVVVDGAEADPSRAQIAAGQDSSGTATSASTSYVLTGTVNNITFDDADITTPANVKVCFVISKGGVLSNAVIKAGVDISVPSAGYATPLTPKVSGAVSAVAQTFSFTGVPTDADQVLVLVGAISNSGAQDLANSPQVDIGNITDATPTAQYAGGGRNNGQLFVASPDVSAGTLDVVVDVFADGDQHRAVAVNVVALKGQTVTVISSEYNEVSGTRTFSEDVLNGDVFVAVGTVYDGAASSTWAGLTQGVLNAGASNTFQAHTAQEVITANETGRNIQFLGDSNRVGLQLVRARAT